MAELKNLRILIAEDDLDDGEFIRDGFYNHPSFSTVDWVKNGKELLCFLEDPANRPDIILTDINMPIVNGIEALELIFRNSLLADIPCFVYSSTANPMYETKCRDLGVRSFLIKPFSLNEYAEIPYQILYILQHGPDAAGGL